MVTEIQDRYGKTVTIIQDRYYTYVMALFYSVVLLAPASLYLEEAFAVLKFPHASRLDFMAACIVVGVLALAYNIQLIKVSALIYLDSTGINGRL